LSSSTSQHARSTAKSSTTAPGWAAKRRISSSSSRKQQKAEGQDDLARHRDRSNLVLRLPALDLGTVRGFKTAFTSTPSPDRSSMTPAASSFCAASTASSSLPTPSRSARSQRRSPRQPDDQPQRTRLRLQQDSYVLQLNKRDLPNILPVDALSRELRKKNEPVVELSPSRHRRVRNPQRNRQASTHRIEARRLASSSESSV